MGTSKFNAGGNPAMNKHPNQREVEILLVASCYRNRVKPRPGLYADFVCFCFVSCKCWQTFTESERTVKVFYATHAWKLLF